MICEPSYLDHKLRIKEQICEFIFRIQNWLLSHQVQIREGLHRGGIAGWLSEDGLPVFLYPEITGYYLTWLAFVSTAIGRSEEIDVRAQAAMSWLARQLSDGAVPSTRVYLTREVKDWHNEGIFAFDLAMIARGVAAAQNLSNGTQGGALLDRLILHLLPFCKGAESLEPILPCASHMEHGLRMRWSSTPGPYQAKTAAALLSLPSGGAIPSILFQAASNSYLCWRKGTALRGLLEDLHPAFYCLEGNALAAAAGWDPQGWLLAEESYRRLVHSPALSHGSNGKIRSDVLAQALRLGCILKSRQLLREPEWNQFLVKLAVGLCEFVEDDGAIRFSKNPSDSHKNVWSAIFAHQAFCFFEVVATGRNLSNEWLRLLI